MNLRNNARYIAYIRDLGENIKLFYLRRLYISLHTVGTVCLATRYLSSIDQIIEQILYYLGIRSSVVYYYIRRQMAPLPRKGNTNFHLSFCRSCYIKDFDSSLLLLFIIIINSFELLMIKMNKLRTRELTTLYYINLYMFNIIYIYILKNVCWRVLVTDKSGNVKQKCTA